jgi:hypothetical protein
MKLMAPESIAPAAKRAIFKQGRADIAKGLQTSGHFCFTWKKSGHGKAARRAPAALTGGRSMEPRAEIQQPAAFGKGGQPLLQSRFQILAEGSVIFQFRREFFRKTAAQVQSVQVFGQSGVRKRTARDQIRAQFFQQVQVVLVV